ncbi:diacylglycerol kinase [Rugosimonospora africana]|uniref:Diacylglycerol kinase n=1 Tax=Rugosimonospora africana TaxID=556532 RepID=A0A8J3QR35_9ACTN|nr:diacylglycerol kinase family protein [Rugosimonospora africana]GIH13943.1 diacylglycerol kinase [Rugosimonospora africana]
MRPSSDPGPVAVLLNPTAGRGRHRDALPGVLEQLRSTGREVTVLPATSADEALAACRTAVASGAGALVAAGGDGTIHLGLQAVAGTGVPFGAIPAGTGNDFVVELGLPGEPLPAAAAIARALREESIRKVDLARMTDAEGNVRWFGAVLAAGFDAIVNERANRMRFPKGPRRYDVAIVAELLRLRPRPYTLVLDGVEHHLDAVLVAVGNTACYGGGMRIVPAADPTDGLLDVVVGGRLSRVAFARIKPHVYRGTHVGHPLVTTYRAATVELRAEGIVSYVDGERSFPLPVTVTSAPGALTLLA